VNATHDPDETIEVKPGDEFVSDDGTLDEEHAKVHQAHRAAEADESDG
jgi:hypothetical protein